MDNMTAKVSCFARAFHYKNNEFTTTIAARLNKVYATGTKEFDPSIPWFQSYVNYDLDQGILDVATGLDIEKLNKAVTRAEFTAILSRSMPDEAISLRDSMIINDY